MSKYALVCRFYNPRSGWSDWGPPFGKIYDSPEEAQMALEEELRYETNCSDYKVIEL